ncbi:MAG: zinc ribbon domain-containing protein [Thermoplasmata archaeon]|nr:zinc ribbon domain-containing protein [Thermoplasmata archaeon]
MCRRCNHENLPEFKFCSVCGEPLDVREQTRRVRLETDHEPPYLRLSDWPFSSLYEKTQTYTQWVNYIMLSSVSVVIFALILAASGEGCIAGGILFLFGLLAFWYWLAGRAGATSSTTVDQLNKVLESDEPVEKEQWHRRM